MASASSTYQPRRPEQGALHQLVRDHFETLRAQAAHMRDGQARRRGVADGRGGAVAVVQRFGAALNLNVHIHALVMDGVFAPDGSGGVSFRTHERQDDELGPLLVTIRRRIEALLSRRGMPDGREGFDASDRWAEDAPALAGLAAASVRGVAALGARAGAPVRRWGDTIELPDPLPLGRWHARQQGFDLHAAIVVPAGNRDRLERLCRYALRPPVGQDRLQLTPDGKAVLELRRRWTDGTTHLVFDPVELLERLAALTPRPRINLILYHGVLAPRAVWRRTVVPSRVTDPEAITEQPACAAFAADADGPRAGRLPNRTWAELMQRSFGFDVLACPRCAGRLKLVALIQEGTVIQRILGHLGLPRDVPTMRSAREPHYRLRCPTIACLETTTENSGQPIGACAGGVSRDRARRSKAPVGVGRDAVTRPECAPRGMP